MRISIPKELIPRPVVTCITCGGPVRTIMSTPLNIGYQRRHACKDDGCGSTFYTLAPYDMSKAEPAHIPFQDEPDEDGEYQRQRWETWQRLKAITFEVPLWQRIGALTIKQEALTPAEDFALKMYRALEKKVKEMENASPVE